MKQRIRYRLFIDGKPQVCTVNLTESEAEIINATFRDDPPDGFRREYRKEGENNVSEE